MVSLVTSWLRCSPSLCDPSSPSLPVTGTSPVSSLLAWPVLAPLVGRCRLFICIIEALSTLICSREEEGQALLHHTLVETILAETGQCQVKNNSLCNFNIGLRYLDSTSPTLLAVCTRVYPRAIIRSKLRVLLLTGGNLPFLCPAWFNVALFQVRSNIGGSHQTRRRSSSRQGAGFFGQRLAEKSSPHYRSLFLQLAGCSE